MCTPSAVGAQPLGWAVHTSVTAHFAEVVYVVQRLPSLLQVFGKVIEHSGHSHAPQADAAVAAAHCQNRMLSLLPLHMESPRQSDVAAQQGRYVYHCGRPASSVLQQ